jgi:hypothetical protein
MSRAPSARREIAHITSAEAENDSEAVVAGPVGAPKRKLCVVVVFARLKLMCP